MAGAAWRFGSTVADPDLWGHIRFGQDKITAGSYIGTDVYSYLTYGRTWFNHEWGGEVIMAGIYDRLGSQGLSLIKVGLTFGVVATLVLFIITRGVRPIRASILGLLAIIALTPTFGTFRPQIFTVVLFVSLLLLIDLVERGVRWPLLVFPLMFMLWVNVHGGVLAGLAVLGTWAVLNAIFAQAEGRWWPLLSAGASLGFSALSPNGVAHLWFLIRTTVVTRPEILDWQPLQVLSPVGTVYVALVLGTLVSLYMARRKLRVATTVPLLVLLVAPFASTRHLQLAVPAIFILGGAALAEASARLDAGKAGASSLPVWLSLGVVIASWAFILPSILVGSSCISVDSAQFQFPTRATHALAGASGKAVVPFNWGEYAISLAGPDLQVSIDGRRETVYPDDVIRANLDFMAGTGQWDRLLELGIPDFVLVPSNTPAAAHMADRVGWVVVYHDPVAEIFAPGPAERLSADPRLPADGDGMCFPA
jgi:hypothetical protein